MELASYKDFMFDGDGHFKIAEAPTSLNVDLELEDEYVEALRKNVKRIAKLQSKLYADRREGLVVMVQAMDAAGKDGTIENVFSGVNPAGIKTACFKTPSKEELAHDYMWRAWRALPERGIIGIFNRSYYEDVLVVRVHEMQHGYNMAERNIGQPTDVFFDQRYRQLRDIERFFDENSYRFIKIFLNVSKDEQRNRFIARIDEPKKNWKFSAGDLNERDLWDDYMDAYELMIDNTSTKYAPWYAIPADQKFVARYLVSEIVKDVLEDIAPDYPELSDAAKADLLPCKERLLAEDAPAEPAEEEAADAPAEPAEAEAPAEEEAAEA